MYICLSLLHPSSEVIFINHFLNPLLPLGTDRVVNVRMSLGEALGLHHSKYGEDDSIIGNIPQLKEIVKLL